MRSILIQSHDDDAFLFACFTAIRARPLIVTVFDSYAQPARGIPGTSAVERDGETAEACYILGLEEVRLGFRDDMQVSPDQVWQRLKDVVPDVRDMPKYLPAFEDGGHEQHNIVAQACSINVIERYLTYTREPCQKSTSAREVSILEPEWIGLKLKALACFGSQFQPATGCAEHFLRSQKEYYL